jgi:hypothetical protein
MGNYPKIRLCVFCVDILDDTLRNPVHLIHPVSGMQMLFDERGEAVCPICQAMWRRERNVMSLAAYGRMRAAGTSTRPMQVAAGNI